MISYIKGILVEILPDRIIVECRDMGYEIRVPISLLYALGTIGSEVKIYTYFQAKEDLVCLYGFRNYEERTIFELLIGVSGIGPKGALAILSELTIEDLRLAVVSDDAKAISKAPGVGLKTAKKIILELKDKLKLTSEFTAYEQLSTTNLNGEKDSVGMQTIQALEALGYTPLEAANAIKSVNITEEMNVEDVLKLALKSLI